MSRLRVLVVDDSGVMRRILIRELSTVEEIGAIDAASGGREALNMFGRHRPDIIILDVCMPGMDGLETLKQIRAIDAVVPVLMFSGLTRHAAKETTEALTLGASDYLTKPSSGVDKDLIQRELVPRLLALTTRPKPTKRSAARRPAPRLSPRAERRVTPELVAIGVSTGGPQALESLLKQFPGDFGAPIVIVQHMPPRFTAYLAQRLDANCRLSVVEASDGEPLHAGTVWLAPGGIHMALAGRRGAARIRLVDTPPENACRPSVDVLFRSVASIYGNHALGVMLTGMGQDGINGVSDMHATGAEILAQDEASSVVWGMPRAVVEAGLAHSVLPLDQIAGAVLNRFSSTLAPTSTTLRSA